MLRSAATGKVTVASPLEVEFDGDNGTSTRVVLGAGSYTPVVDDRVFLLKLGAQWVLIDSLETR